jgi:hypothetical protein
MGTRNPNHRNFTLPKEDVAPIEEVVEEPVEEIVEEEDGLEEIELEQEEITEEYLYALNKKEQIELLEEIGYGSKDIKKLKKESDRVNEILKHVGVE